ncbi:hypothetical protein CBR_g21209 [Chara braunii]|uniref:Integrase catalytic domain-containing protein n=1 Tax=Chara braunii TaxID=69332 RepID=A0A388L0Z5_CHABU|nr:hypothetical protein CBR_g21209 [Chara braunii]|eukprot:GBG75967.1 hypothetical protein CBR_g21209 [Chara braunii]
MALTVQDTTGDLPACPVREASEPLADYRGRLQAFTDAVAAAEAQQAAAEAERQRLANEAAAEAQRTAETDEAARNRRNAASTESLITSEHQWTTILQGMIFVPTETQAEPTQVEAERSNLATVMLNQQQQQQLMNSTIARINGIEAKASAAPGCTTDATKQIDKRIDHVVTIIYDIGGFNGPDTISSTVAAIKTDITKLQRFLTEASCRTVPANDMLKALYLQLIGGAQAWMNHLAATHKCTIAELHTHITWKEFEQLWFTRIMVRNVVKAVMNEVYTCSQRNMPTRDWTTKWQKIAPTGTVPDRPIRHGITLEAGAAPPRGCIYRMSEDELEVLRAQLDDLLDKGWIRPSCSPYGAPVLFVRKKNKDLQLSIDYRKLNAQTVKNAGPLPRIDDLLKRLGGATYFWKLDLKSGYHQIEIQPQDRYTTAFKTRYGHFEWVAMPFGLTNAPATFQAAMTTEFRDLLDRSVLIYLDDILVYSRTLDEHIVHLRVVLNRLRLAKYKANLDKCEFARQELEYLGNFVTPKGIRPLADKIQAIIDWPEPRCTTDVRSFMGLAGYYQRFVESYSKVVAPLSRLQSPKGVLEDIVSDRDTRFMSTFWTSLMTESGMTMKPSSARHPQTDGQTERAHQTAQMMLRTLICPEQKDWVDWLADIEFAYNTSVHPTICVTPFELHHGGEKARIFADLLLPQAAVIDVPCSPASIRKYRDVLIKARANMEKAQIRMQQQANRRRLPCPFREGDRVWVLSEEFALEQDVSRKLLPKWFGPWEVTSAVGDDPAGPSFVINIPPHLTVHRVFHASKLAIYTPPSADELPGRRS